jgi:predicted CopG family antitoxin
MKRLNILIDNDLYEKARAFAFIKRESISELIRKSLRAWIEKNLDKRAKILLSESDEERLLHILETDEFIQADKAKENLGL